MTKHQCELVDTVIKHMYDGWRATGYAEYRADFHKRLDERIKRLEKTAMFKQAGKA
jgi:hypothetical protein